MFMAAAHAVSLVDPSPAAAADAGLSVVPSARRLAEAIRTARDLAAAGPEWEVLVEELYARYGALHWVHAINNTALVAAAMYSFQDFGEAICAVVQGGWDTDTNGAAIGSVFGACSGAAGIPDVWAAPLHGRIASSLPGFDGVTIDELTRRTLAVVDAARPAAPAATS